MRENNQKLANLSLTTCYGHKDKFDQNSQFNLQNYD